MQGRYDMSCLPLLSLLSLVVSSRRRALLSAQLWGDRARDRRRRSARSQASRLFSGPPAPVRRDASPKDRDADRQREEERGQGEAHEHAHGCLTLPVFRVALLHHSSRLSFSCSSCRPCGWRHRAAAAADQGRSDQIAHPPRRAAASTRAVQRTTDRGKREDTQRDDFLQ